MKDFLCNIPLYIGMAILFAALGVKKLAEKFMELSFRLHIYANTESGQKMAQYAELVRKQAEQMKAAQADATLAKILLNRSPNGKPTDN